MFSIFGLGCKGLLPFLELFLTIFLYCKMSIIKEMVISIFLHLINKNITNFNIIAYIEYPYFKH